MEKYFLMLLILVGCGGEGVASTSKRVTKPKTATPIIPKLKETSEETKKSYKKVLEELKQNADEKKEKEAREEAAVTATREEDEELFNQLTEEEVITLARELEEEEQQNYENNLNNITSELVENALSNAMKEIEEEKIAKEEEKVKESFTKVMTQLEQTAKKEAMREEAIREKAREIEEEKKWEEFVKERVAKEKIAKEEASREKEIAQELQDFTNNINKQIEEERMIDETLGIEKDLEYDNSLFEADNYVEPEWDNSYLDYSNERYFIQTKLTTLSESTSEEDSEKLKDLFYGYISKGNIDDFTYLMSIESFKDKFVSYFDEDITPIGQAIITRKNLLEKDEPTLLGMLVPINSLATKLIINLATKLEIDVKTRHSYDSQNPKEQISKIGKNHRRKYANIIKRLGYEVEDNFFTNE